MTAPAPVLTESWAGWLASGANWRDQVGTPGIPSQLASHLEYSLLGLVIAAAIGLPLGLLIGHTDRAHWVVAVVNGVRALPTTGLLILCYVLLAPHITGTGDSAYLIPTEIVLVVLAVPPLLASAFAGVQNVDPAVRDASRGMGMTGSQVLWRVEVPNALPLLLSGVRSATLQLIATATVAAYVGLGGFGRFLYDGLASHDYGEVVGGAVLVAALALVADGVLALVERVSVSPGVSRRTSRWPLRGARRTPRRSSQPDARSTALQEVPEP